MLIRDVIRNREPYSTKASATVQEAAEFMAMRNIGAVCVIGHNCRIGPGNLIISATCISGSTTTGKYVVMAGQVGIAGHLRKGAKMRVAERLGL